MAGFIISRFRVQNMCIHQCLWEGGFGLLLNLCGAVCLDRMVFLSQLALHLFSLGCIKNFLHFFFFYSFAPFHLLDMIICLHVKSNAVRGR